MRTGYDLFRLAVERTPDHRAIVDDATSQTLTYRDLLAEVETIAAGLHQRGVRDGDRIVTALPNVLEHCLVLLALQRLGAVPAFFNYRLPPQQIAEMIREADATGAVILNDAALVETLATMSPRLKLVLVVDADPTSEASFSTCRAAPDGLPPIPRPDPDATAFIFYTSGTTGRPKGALLTHRTTEFRISSISPVTGLRAGPHLRALGILPLFHGIGFYCVFMTTLVYNGTYVLMPEFDPAKALDLIERHRINFLFVVPTVLQAIVSCQAYAPRRVSSLEYVFHGGAAIGSSLLEQLCREWPCGVQHLYGTTETYIPLANASPKGTPRTLSAVYPHRVRVVTVGAGVHDLVEPGDAGELIVDAGNDCMFSGYLNAPDLYARKVRDGWYFTGDVCVHRLDGDFDFVGRVDDAIRSGGETIYPAEIEAVLATHANVLDVCVVGISDKYWGEKVVAAIVSASGELSPGQLDDHCKAAVLASFKRPRDYVFLDRLPRNASNKILRRDVQSLVAQRQNDRLRA